MYRCEDCKNSSNVKGKWQCDLTGMRIDSDRVACEDFLLDEGEEVIAEDFLMKDE